MNTAERNALKHAADELTYRRSPQAKADAAADQQRREAADRKAGHLPTCGILKCAPGCTHSKL